MVKVELIGRIVPTRQFLCSGVDGELGEADYLSWIANQSKRKEPKIVDGLFGRTVERDEGSIQEFAVYQFRITGISKVAHTQLVRHRMASYNATDSRVVAVTDVVCPPTLEEKAGAWFKATVEKLIKEYEHLVSIGVPREEARYILPQGSAGNIICQFNGRSLRNFLKLRSYPPAQWEIREVARQMREIVEKRNPEMVEGL